MACKVIYNFMCLFIFKIKNELHKFYEIWRFLYSIKKIVIY